MSATLLKALATRQNYEKYFQFVEPYVVGDAEYKVLEAIGGYFEYNKDLDEVKDWDDFYSYLTLVRFPSVKSSTAATYRSIVDVIKKTAPSSISTDQLVNSFVVRDYAAQIADLALEVAEGEKDSLDEVRELLDKCDERIGKVTLFSTLRLAADIHDLLSTLSVTGGYKWRLPELNKSFPNIVPGNFIVIGARPEIGKTTFLASEVTFIAPQLPPGKKVFWFNNEEPNANVKQRLVVAATGLPITDVMSNPVAAYEAYVRAVGDWERIEIFRVTRQADVNRILREHENEVGMIVFDQIHKIHPSRRRSNGEVADLGETFEWGRNLAGDYHVPVITVHQADTTAAGQQWLADNQLYGIKTLAQGEADLLIMIGVNLEGGNEDKRYLNIVKNKTMGCTGYDENLRHAKWIVTIDRVHQRYEGTA